MSDPSESNIDRDNLEITGAHQALDRDANLRVEGTDDVLIVITQAYGSTGEQLVGISDHAFDGYPALTLLVRAQGREELVHLSSIHGDDRKIGLADLAVGSKCELLCPTSKQPLDVVGDIQGADNGAQWCAIYLTPALSKGSSVLVSNVWGHYHSRITHDSDLISHWSSQHDELAAHDGASDDAS